MCFCTWKAEIRAPATRGKVRNAGFNAAIYARPALLFRMWQDSAAGFNHDLCPRPTCFGRATCYHTCHTMEITNRPQVLSVPSSLSVVASSSEWRWCSCTCTRRLHMAVKLKWNLWSQRTIERIKEPKPKTFNIFQYLTILIDTPPDSEQYNDREIKSSTITT